MKIPVVGFDPSLTHWGIAKGDLDLTTGILDSIWLKVVKPIKPSGKQVRQNSIDLQVAEELASEVFDILHGVKAVFVECPVGSQTARAMTSYGVCVGILGAVRSIGIQLIEVTATEVKLAMTGQKNATKAEMIAAAIAFYPEVEFPNQRGRVIAEAEHVADALGAIHAGVNTPVFRNVLKLLEK